MGLGKKVLNITPRELKDAQRIIKSLEIIGISEDDLLELKNIPAMKQELTELREFKSQVLRTANNEAGSANQDKFSIKKMMEAFTEEVEEFNPDGKAK